MCIYRYVTISKEQYCLFQKNVRLRHEQNNAGRNHYPFLDFEIQITFISQDLKNIYKINFFLYNCLELIKDEEEKPKDNFR